jgi:hypothetical protein
MRREDIEEERRMGGGLVDGTAESYCEVGSVGSRLAGGCDVRVSLSGAGPGYARTRTMVTAST